MEELNKEEEVALRELLEVYQDGADIDTFISDKLFHELAEYGEPDEMGERQMIELPGHAKQKSIYVSLIEKGMLRGFRPSRFSWYFDVELTSNGRCYFENQKKRKSEERKRKWSDRRFAIFMALLSFALSVLASWIITNREIDSALMSLLGG
ncbi:hypothetical protein [Adlercreutzia sp. ZJ141]|uniref:hypothetical protein n=1 Tax=Adlercreutzia sp. ZJ141 TaxID=2709406 RepID=UPI0013EDBB66|nr:hypothetical protein [Adlercreutzia sp. ZJ141]